METRAARRGFTLIEILIVVTILLSLSVIGAIKYVSVVEQNNINLDIVNARTLAEGIKIAGLSGAIDLKKDVVDQPITDPDLESFLDTSIIPHSKKYGENNSKFVYSIKNQRIKISANGITVYEES